jgi:hypothetical protein
LLRWQIKHSSAGMAKLRLQAWQLGTDARSLVAAEALSCAFARRRPWPLILVVLTF